VKQTIRIVLLFILFIIISLVCTLRPDDFFVNTIFTVSGIIFSVGLGLIVTFNIGGVKNKKHIKQLRTNINNVRNSFIIYFFITTVSYILDKYLRDSKIILTFIHIKNFKIELNWSVFFCLLMLYSIVYYIINFIEIQKLNNDIFDKTNEQID
jgi:hypothetical protein